MQVTPWPKRFWHENAVKSFATKGKFIRFDTILVAMKPKCIMLTIYRMSAIIYQKFIFHFRMAKKVGETSPLPNLRA